MSNIEELKFDKKNFNRHTENGMRLLEKSLREFGAGRSILVDKDNNIIAGNGIVESAMNAGITKTRVVETTGDELVVVKRTDVELDTKRGREMALADNATASADLEWDDWEEPRTFWYLENDGDVDEETSDGDNWEERMKSIGNYFATREEAEKAVEKLKAWQRLKERYNFRFNGLIKDKKSGKLTGVRVAFKSTNVTMEESFEAERDTYSLFGGDNEQGSEQG